MNNIIIHFPFKIDRNRAAASQLRPIKIIESFKAMKYNVFLVEGYGEERKRQIKEIKSAITSGMRFEFVYSECNTTPTLLTEKHHYPTYPFLDFSFFKFCKNKEIPIGLFYRDIYWCFPENNKSLERKVVKLFHKYDLVEYNKYVSTLFVPSVEMVSHIPFTFKMPVVELYPGCDVNDNNEKKNNSCVNILYVGGVGRHYDVSMIMEAVKGMPSCNLTICCRPDDWELAKEDYKELISDNISIVHKSGKELKDLYINADLFCLFVKPDKYREFAVPFKLFETIGNTCPIIASKGTWVAKFVEQNGIGYTCNYDRDALKDLLIMILQNTSHLTEIRKRIYTVRLQNTWECRCRKIAETLIKD